MMKAEKPLSKEDLGILVKMHEENKIRLEQKIKELERQLAKSTTAVGELRQEVARKDKVIAELKQRMKRMIPYY